VPVATCVCFGSWRSDPGVRETERSRLKKVKKGVEKEYGVIDSPGCPRRARGCLQRVEGSRESASSGGSSSCPGVCGRDTPPGSPAAAVPPTCLKVLGHFLDKQSH